MSVLITPSLVVLLRNRQVLNERLNGSVVYSRESMNSGNLLVARVDYSRPFNEKWVDSELLASIVSLDCHGDSLFKFSFLPDLPNCRFLDCSKNALTSLPRLDVCEVIYCNHNRLQEIRLLPACKLLACYSNPLVSIPPLPTIENSFCDDYGIPMQIVSTINGIYLYEDYWRKRWSHLRKKYLRLWYRAMLKRKAIKRRGLHEELRYSPDTLIENEYTLAKRSFESKQMSDSSIKLT